jgi:hypothetical protein
MIRYYIISLVVIFIVIPRNTYSLFTDSILNIIDSTGNVTCYMTSTNTSDDFHLCAIRIYTYTADGDVPQTASIGDGIWFTNTFRQLIETRNCTGFDSASDIGSGMCVPMPYENVITMTLCICSTDNCNQNLEECQKSNAENPNTSPLPNIISDLATVIECANTSSNSFTCSPSLESPSFIDSSACEAYVDTHSVLCTIIDDGTDVLVQEALIEENYQSYLTNRLHLLQLLSKQISIQTPDQTDTSVYVTYPNNNGRMDQECGCTENSFCNYNIGTCAPKVIQTQTTNSMELASTSVTDTTAEFVSTSLTDSTAIFTATSVTDLTTELLSTFATNSMEESTNEMSAITMEPVEPLQTTEMSTTTESITYFITAGNIYIYIFV